MFYPTAPQLGAGPVTYAVISLLFVLGIVLLILAPLVSGDTLFHAFGEKKFDIIKVVLYGILY